MVFVEMLEFLVRIALIVFKNENVLAIDSKLNKVMDSLFSIVGVLRKPPNIILSNDFDSD